MREIKREYVTTDYQILKNDNGTVNEVGHIILEGTEDFQKARKKALKAYPEFNIFIGEVKTEKAIYTMPAEQFIKEAKKEII